MNVLNTTANPEDLLRASEAVMNWRALTMTVLSGVAVFLFIALTGWLARSSIVLGGIFVILTLLVALVGYSSVGIILMRQAQGRDTGLVDALLQAVFTVHRLLGVAILLALISLGIVLGAMLILFICRIPGIGSMLYGVAYPAVAVVLGVTLAGLCYVGFPLAAPAIWEGNSVFETIARMAVIVQRRLLFVIVSLLMLMLLVAVLSAVVSFVLIGGNLAAVSLSSAVGIPVLGGMGGLLQGLMFGRFGMRMGMDAAGFSDVSSYTYAFCFGSGLLFTVGAIIPMLTFINGNCLIYLQAVAGLEFGHAEDKLRAGVDEARRRAQEARERVHTRLEESASTAELSVAHSSTRQCSRCGSALGADDQFCGECGARNPA